MSGLRSVLVCTNRGSNRAPETVVRMLMSVSGQAVVAVARERQPCTTHIGLRNITLPCVIRTKSGSCEKVSIRSINRRALVIDQAWAQKFAKEWIAAWNSHDLD